MGTGGRVTGTAHGETFPRLSCFDTDCSSSLKRATEWCMKSPWSAHLMPQPWAGERPPSASYHWMDHKASQVNRIKLWEMQTLNGSWGPRSASWTYFQENGSFENSFGSVVTIHFRVSVFYLYFLWRVAQWTELHWIICGSASRFPHMRNWGRS